MVKEMEPYQAHPRRPSSRWERGRLRVWDLGDTRGKTAQGTLETGTGSGLDDS